MIASTLTDVWLSISFFIPRSSFPDRAMIMRSYPFWARILAKLRPIPLDAPVMIAILLFFTLLFIWLRYKKHQNLQLNNKAYWQSPKSFYFVHGMRNPLLHTLGEIVLIGKAAVLKTAIVYAIWGFESPSLRNKSNLFIRNNTEIQRWTLSGLERVSFFLLHDLNKPWQII